MKKTISLMRNEDYTVASVKTEERSKGVVTFSEEDECQEGNPHDDSLVITTMVTNFDVRRILVDTGSLVNVLFLNSYKLMGFDLNSLVPTAVPVYGFAGERNEPMEEIILPVQMGDEQGSTVKLITFLVIDAPSAYNSIFGRPLLNQFRAMTSTYHLVLKFPRAERQVIIMGEMLEARKCYLRAINCSMISEDASVWEADEVLKERHWKKEKT